MFVWNPFNCSFIDAPDNWITSKEPVNNFSGFIESPCGLRCELVNGKIIMYHKGMEGYLPSILIALSEGKIPIGFKKIDR